MRTTFRFLRMACHAPLAVLVCLQAGVLGGCSVTGPPAEGHSAADMRSIVTQADRSFSGGKRRAILADLYAPRMIPGNNPKRTYFFMGDQYTRLDFQPGATENATLLVAKKAIAGAWPSLNALGIDRYGVDAFIQTTNSKKENIAYAFSGPYYVKIKFIHGGGDRLLDGPRFIKERWSSLTQAGFDSIDAAFSYQFYGSEFARAYVFKDSKYAVLKVSNQGESTLESGPYNIIDNWRTLKNAGFSHIDAILPVNGYPSNAYPWHRAYFFSGDRYLLMKFKPGTNKESLISGPTLISKGWPLLK